MAEFKSVVKDTKSNTKNITKSILIHIDYQGLYFGKCLCLAFSSLRKIWTPELLRITKKKNNIQTLLILPGITFCKKLVNRPNSTKEFDFIRDCKISHQLWKEVKVGEQRQIPGVNITKVCANLWAHLIIAIHVGWGIFVRTCILLVFICGNYLCESN